MTKEELEKKALEDAKKVNEDKSLENKDKEEGEDKKEDKETKIDSKKLLEELEELKTYKSKIEKEKSDLERQSLINEGKIKEAYELDLKAKEEEVNKYKKDLLNTKKEVLMEKYGISDKFGKFISGDSIEELEASVKDLAEELGTLTGKEKVNKVKDGLGKVNEGDNKDKKGAPGVFTIEQIKNMSVEEYTKNRDEINKQIKAGLIK